jgi:hypothetical protein
MLKYLRIAVTALSLTACVLLVVLWVQSYVWLANVWGGTRQTGVTIQSLRGECQLGIVANKDEYLPPYTGMRFERVSGEYSDNSDVRELNWGGFWATWDTQDDLYPQLRHSFIGCRYSLLVIAFGGLAALSWRPWRFSLRTLLIATTLVAVGLGIVVVAM